jgi:hypothetical protein
MALRPLVEAHRSPLTSSPCSKGSRHTVSREIAGE